MDSKWRVLDFTAYEGFLSYERGRIVAGERSTPLAEVDFQRRLGSRHNLHY